MKRFRGIERISFICETLSRALQTFLKESLTKNFNFCERNYHFNFYERNNNFIQEGYIGKSCRKHYKNDKSTKKITTITAK